MNRLDLAVTLGAATGLGLATAWRLYRPAPPPLSAALGRIGTRAQAPIVPAATRPGRWAQAAALPLAAPPTLSTDLRLVGRAPADHLAAKWLGALLGALLPFAWTSVMAVAGVPINAMGTLLAASLMGAWGFLWPDVRLRGEAARRRRDFLTALGSFLDLVVIALAGGAGVEGALHSAVGIGRGWAVGELRATLNAAQLNGDNLWDALSGLGRDLRVPVLEEIAATVGLAGAEGARVRDSLSAKTAALRQAQLAEAESDAQAATERMTIPTVLLLAGFMVLIGYPALNAVMTGI